MLSLIHLRFAEGKKRLKPPVAEVTAFVPSLPSAPSHHHSSITHTSVGFHQSFSEQQLFTGTNLKGYIWNIKKFNIRARALFLNYAYVLANLSLSVLTNHTLTKTKAGMHLQGLKNPKNNKSIHFWMSYLMYQGIVILNTTI